MNGRPWTAAEDAIVAETYPMHGSASTSKRLVGRSPAAVAMRARAIGVKNVVSLHKNGVVRTMHGVAKPPPKPKTGPARTAGKGDDSRAKKTVAATPAGRYAVDPGHRGEFSKAGPGFDVLTGAAWKAA